MKHKVEAAEIYLWSSKVGAVAWDHQNDCAIFEFEKKFFEKDLDIAPLWMPLEEALRGNTKFSFPALRKETFKGLPGMLADALPDNYGNSIIHVWLAAQGRSIEDFSPVERLCYMGKRAMGALEFKPSLRTGLDASVPIQINDLLILAEKIIHQKKQLQAQLTGDQTKALIDIIRVGSSAGGNRPKAVIALNDKTKQIRSGQLKVPEGFTHWILKFDGLQDNGLGDPKGYGTIEYVYFQMATAAGIQMNECRLLKENNRAHFMTRRFDRAQNNEKLHMQTLCALAHFDYNAPGEYSYEQAFEVIRKLKLPYSDREQMFRRMAFNIVARNQDDHTKNISFLMNEQGQWQLAPAYDVIFACNLSGEWTNKHQMSANGKRDHFTKEDLKKVGDTAEIKGNQKIIDEVIDAVKQWPDLAKKEGVGEEQIKLIGDQHRLLKR